MLAQVSQPPEASSQLDANLAKQFVWLLREDLRRTYKTLDNPAFEDWWLIKGRQEYPVWGLATTAQELMPLFESSGKAKIAGVSIVVPKVVKLLALYRGDAVKEYTQNGILDNEKFFAWAMVVGLADHHLAVHAPRHVLAMLDQPVSTLRGTGDTKATANKAPSLTLLMYLLWLLMDEPTQQARNIHTPEGCKAYLIWFFGAVGQLNIVTLVAGRWKSWVKSQPSCKDSQLALANVELGMPVRSRPKIISEKPFGVNLYGFAYGELGIGEDLRMAVACCQAANIPHHVVNVDAGNIRQADNFLKGKTHDLHSKDLPPYGINIFCLPAFDTVSQIFMKKGASAFEGYHNIGWWPWELSVFPEAWKPHAFKLVDEVWASSAFLEDMYKRYTEKPVHLVPLAVSVERLKKNPRKYYGLPEKKFLFLYVFDFNSSLARKNPMATISAFRKAFSQSDSSVGLVFKTMNTKPANLEWQAFIDQCKSDKRIYVLTETMDRPDVLGLIECCDVYVSLHRAEGFGRTIAEALILDKPIIATNYSGNVGLISVQKSLVVDFDLILIGKNEYYWVEESDLACWADPHVDKASEIMKKYRNNPKITQKFKSEYLSPNLIGSKIKNILKNTKNS
jgi:glycosyltransferase involved in cell wall biosynthesis